MEPRTLAEIDIPIDEVLSGDYTLTISIEVPDVENLVVSEVLKNDSA